LRADELAQNNIRKETPLDRSANAGSRYPDSNAQRWSGSRKSSNRISNKQVLYVIIESLPHLGFINSGDAPVARAWLGQKTSRQPGLPCSPT
jgi:hypothetical protein